MEASILVVVVWCLLFSISNAQLDIIGSIVGYCGVNEVFNDCGTACPKTCANRNVEISCIDVCVKGCFCEDGYVRNDDRKCVKPDQCPPITCGVGEEYTDCGTACPLTCGNIHDPPTVCTLQCVQGCFCQPGLVRNDEERCVEPCKCPSNVCGINEIYTKCGTACPKTCANRNIGIACFDICVEGCFCKDGYVRNDARLCVKPDQCPPDTCGIGEEYTDCGTACPLTCDNIDDPPICIQQCVSGCFCVPGLVRNKGKCVEPNECPNGGANPAPSPGASGAVDGEAAAAAAASASKGGEATTAAAASASKGGAAAGSENAPAPRAGKKCAPNGFIRSMVDMLS